jgi:hypothetical protein
MGEPWQKRLLAPGGLREARPHEELPVHHVLGLIQPGAGHRHRRSCADHRPACVLGLPPVACLAGGGDMVGAVA